MTGTADLDAGPFGAWLAGMLRALEGEQDADVPCGTCTACCTSSQFVHIEPDETDALAHIPAELLFPAPLRPRGHVLLGFDERGHCPMLVHGACSIYEHRPRTCRTYDCRVFAASGVDVDDDGPDPAKVDIARRARRWRFDLTVEADVVLFDAVHAAARRAGAGEPGLSPTQRAVRAVRETPMSSSPARRLTGGGSEPREDRP
jgi:uncharacterized protein